MNSGRFGLIPTIWGKAVDNPGIAVGRKAELTPLDRLARFSGNG
jgi:hypothetical protein